MLAPERVFPDLRWIIASSEPLTWDLVGELRSHLTPEAVVVNVFGLTEALSVAGMGIPSSVPLGTGVVPAGRPLRGVHVSIVDEAGQSVDMGESGEIVIESQSCSLGYWNRPELTEQVFRDLGQAGRKVFTGDLGLLTDDGVLEHLGRIDRQVKIAGSRVEPGEVEAALRAENGVSDAAVVAIPDAGGDNRLTAFVVPLPNATIHPDLIRASLTRRMPRTLVPDSIGTLDELPRLPSGKLDRASLVEYRVPSASDQAEVGEMTDVERTLSAIWAAVLDVDQVGIHDDFFALGGDSLRAARVIAEMDRRLGLQRPLSLLAEFPTVATLAIALQDQDASSDSLVPIKMEGSLPPVFVIHAQDGDVIFARGIASAIGADVPVYALRAEGLDGRAPRFQTIPELARYFVTLIRNVHPDGPYCLYGWSVGGLIAFEMACQLQAAGAVVTLLAVGDTRPPGLPVVTASRRAKSTRHWKRFRAGNAHEQVAYASSVVQAHLHLRLGKLWRRATGASERDEQKRQTIQRAIDRGEAAPPHLVLEYVSIHTVTVALRYERSMDFKGDLLMLKGRGSTNDVGWESMILGHIEVRDIPAPHSLFHTDPAQTRIGELLGAAVRSTAQHHATP
jgi:thioesterase domain-containing protein/acyl carrier protein